jgi:hypothetical protein
MPFPADDISDLSDDDGPMDASRKKAEKRHGRTKMIQPGELPVPPAHRRLPAGTRSVEASMDLPPKPGVIVGGGSNISGQSLAIWNRFFDNAMKLTSSRENMVLFKLPASRAYEWPEPPEAEEYTQMVEMSITQPHSHVKEKNLNVCILYAIILGDIESVERLLNMGADPNARDDQQRAPTHYACKVDNVEMLSMLVDYGADLDVIDMNGRTPLLLATVYGSKESVIYLLESAIQVNAIDYDGNSALHLISHNGHKSVSLAILLLEYEADRTLTNAIGLNALEYAEAINQESNDLDALIAILKDGPVGLSNRKSGYRKTEYGWGLIENLANYTLNSAQVLMDYTRDALFGTSTEDFSK